MPSPRAVLFDFDSTLLDNSGVGEAIRAACRELTARLPELDPERAFAANAAMWDEYWPEIADDWALGGVDAATVSTEAWRRTLERCGYTDPELARHARNLHDRHERALLGAYADVAALFEQLHGRYALGLVTNGAADRQRAFLAAVELDDAFDVLAISSERGVAKPDPRIFEWAMGELGVDPDATWFVGDNPVNDVGGAQAAAITAVWLNRDGRAWPEALPRPDHEVESLLELPALLAG